jgi:thiamine biosynthesis lipoprotein
MDTVMTLKAYGQGADEALADVEAAILGLDAELSRIHAGSPIELLNTAAGTSTPVILTEDAGAVLAASSAFAKKTGGAFDPTLGPLIDLWGIGSGKERVVPDSEIAPLLELVGIDGLTLGDFRPASRHLPGFAAGTPVPRSARLADEGASVDLGGIGKGYASEVAVGLLEDAGVRSALLSLGGNVAVVGRKPSGERWRVGIRDPAGTPSEYVGTVDSEDEYLIVSGDYERFFMEDGVRFHHLLDPDTGAPARSGLRSAAIVCGSGTMGDAYSTALFVMGLDRATDFWRANDGFEAVFVTTDGLVAVTEGLADRFRFTGTEAGYRYEVILHD